ncbi:MAG TPA: ClbS/DfsB family four-helix bundle protein [Ktedonobacterales bacterium]
MSAETMSKSLLLERMRAGRAEWEALLAGVPEGHMAEPGIEGEWSVKDILAHTTVYEQWTADQLDAAQRGQTEMVVRPDIPPGADSFDTDERNAAYYAAHRDRPLADIAAWSRDEYPRLLAAVEALPEDVLITPGCVPLMGGGALWELVASNSYDHYAVHAAAIRAWLAGE